MLPGRRFVNNLMGCGASRQIALTVAGFDPSAGAGVTADLKVFAAHGLYGLAAITALTVQSTQGVSRVRPIPGQLLRETLECLAEDFSLAGVKIGMLGSAAVARVVAAFLTDARIPRDRVVLDPVVRSSSGAELLSTVGLRILREKLLPVVGWITPNVDELAVLAGEPVPETDSIPELARRLAASAPGLNVVVTGGHLDPPHDFLQTASGHEEWFPGKRVETTSTHGTGCAFSSALLSRMLLGEGPAEAVRSAKAFVTRALETAEPLGRGKGPALSGIPG